MANPAITSQKQSRSDRGTFSATATDTDLCVLSSNWDTAAENEATSC